MTTEEIIELAGHRQVPPWVMKLVGDCVAKEREECAKLADIWVRAYDHPSEAIARSIRTRGNTTQVTPQDQKREEHMNSTQSDTNSNLPMTTEESSETQDEVDIRSRLYQRIHELETKFAERNFCSRCGKRLGTEDWDIHTCSLPDREISESNPCVSEENAPIGKSLWRKSIWRKAYREDDDDIQEYKKPWVGLTDEEVWEIASTGNYGGSFGDLSWQDCTLNFVRVIESKLKEKNT